MCLIYLSPVPWASFSQRPHKFVEWFHKRTGRQVLWVEPYPTRFPRISDFRRTTSTKHQTGAALPQWLKVLTPKALPLEPLPGSGWVNRWLWSSLINELKADVGTSEPLVVVGKPSMLALRVLDVFNPQQSIYDAMDDFPAFYSGWSRLAMARRESSLVQRVEKVWVSSTALKRRWTSDDINVCFVPNALDNVLLPPVDLARTKSSRKVFGYVGTIGAWFDWDWVQTLAKLRPDDVIRLIGPVFSPAPFELPSNVELLPPCAHDVALNAMCQFDVGLIPFKRSELTVSVDPIKYYEYRALGLPIISTDFGEMQFRVNAFGTFICKKSTDIYSVTNAAVAFRDSAESISKFAMQNTWAARFDAADIVF